MAFAGSSPWMPGTYGKGYIAPDGLPETWTTDSERHPQHMPRAGTHGYDSPITILPDGRAVSSNEINTPMTGPPDGQEQAVCDTHPKLRLVTVDEFRAASDRVSYAHAGKLTVPDVKPALQPQTLRRSDLTSQDRQTLPEEMHQWFAYGAPRKLDPQSFGYDVPEDLYTIVRVTVSTDTWNVMSPRTQTQLHDRIKSKLPARYIRSVGQTSRSSITLPDVWGFQTIWFDIYVVASDENMPKNNAAATFALERYFAEQISDLPLRVFPRGLAPQDIVERAYALHDRKLADAEAAHRDEARRNAPSDDEKTVVLDALRTIHDDRPKKHTKAFTSEARLAEITGPSRDRLTHTLDALSGDGKVIASGVYTTWQNIGGYWTINAIFDTAMTFTS